MSDACARPAPPGGINDVGADAANVDADLGADIVAETDITAQRNVDAMQVVGSLGALLAAHDAGGDVRAVLPRRVLGAVRGGPRPVERQPLDYLHGVHIALGWLGPRGLGRFSGTVCTKRASNMFVATATARMIMRS